MDRCISIVKTTGEVCGKRCTGELCNVHSKPENTARVRFGDRLPTQCWHCFPDRRCDAEIVNNETRRCQNHSDIVFRHRLRTRIERIKNNLGLQILTTRESILQVMPRLMEGGDLYDPFFTQQNAFHDRTEGFLYRLFQVRHWFHLHQPLVAYYDWVVGGQVGDPPAEVIHQQVVVQQPQQPLNLGILARDRQNVHTTPVTKHTNEMTTLLLDIVISENVKQRCIETIVLNWMNPLLRLNYVRASWVIQDVHKWFIVPTCRSTSDWLYRELLYAVVEKIVSEKDEETQRELWKRLYEECSEAMNMCCEGHISRLCNVFVGFDDAFKSPVPRGEVLQNAMAMIAGGTKNIEAKIEEAKKVFEELQVSQHEIEIWLEALVNA